MVIEYRGVHRVCQSKRRKGDELRKVCLGYRYAICHDDWRDVVTTVALDRLPLERNLLSARKPDPAFRHVCDYSNAAFSLFTQLRGLPKSTIYDRTGCFIFHYFRLFTQLRSDTFFDANFESLKTQFHATPIAEINSRLFFNWLTRVKEKQSFFDLDSFFSFCVVSSRQ